MAAISACSMKAISKINFNGRTSLMNLPYSQLRWNFDDFIRLLASPTLTWPSDKSFAVANTVMASIGDLAAAVSKFRCSVLHDFKDGLWQKSSISRQRRKKGGVLSCHRARSLAALWVSLWREKHERPANTLLCSAIKCVRPGS